MAQVTTVHALGRLTPANTQRALAILEEWIDKLAILRSVTSSSCPARFRERAEAAVAAAMPRMFGLHATATTTAAVGAPPVLRVPAEPGAAVSESATPRSEEAEAEAATRDLQVLVEEHSRELHISTEVLQGGTDGSTATSATLKADARRALLAAVLAKIADELRRYGGAFRALNAFVEGERTAKRLAAIVRERTEKVVAETAKLEEDLKAENSEADAEKERQEAEIMELKQRLAELRSSTAMECKVLRKELKAKSDTQKRVLADRDAEMAAELADLRKRVEAEDKVNAMMTQFLEDRYGKLQQQVNEWMNKFETDTEKQSHGLESLKVKKERDLVRLYDCRERSREVGEEIAKRRKAAELQRDIEALEQKKAGAALVIQTRWRGYKARKAFESMKRRLTARAKKKGGAAAAGKTGGVKLPKIGKK